MTRPPLRGDELPSIFTPPPGPKSRASARRLRRAEGGAIWGRDEAPVVWSRARGAIVEDLDGNRYLDLTSGFGVASLGHAAPDVRRAVSTQAGRLTQGLGDLMPHRERERLVRALSALGGRLDRVLLASTGSEAVELAIKTAAVATGRRRVIAFEGAYHGESHGALALTHHPPAPSRLRDQLPSIAVHVPYPYPYRCPLTDGCGDRRCDLGCWGEALTRIDRELEGPDPPGAIIVEPIQGRAGGIVPPAEFLPRLCEAARARGLVVIYDEVLTGAGRTGPFWAWQRSGPDAEPDLLCAGKGLGGGVAIAALFGRSEFMEAWRSEVLPSGEAPHASTFYAHPLACAGAFATIRRLTAPGFREAVQRKGAILSEGLARLGSRHALVGEARSAGLLASIELVTDRGSRAPGTEIAGRLWSLLLSRGILTVPGGLHENVISLYPPLTITDEQLRFGLKAIDEVLGSL